MVKGHRALRTPLRAQRRCRTSAASCGLGAEVAVDLRDRRLHDEAAAAHRIEIAIGLEHAAVDVQGRGRSARGEIGAAMRVTRRAEECARLAFLEQGGADEAWL